MSNGTEGQPARKGRDEVRAATAALTDGIAELEAMRCAIEAAQHELAQARAQLSRTTAPGKIVRSVLSHLLPEIGRPAILVDADLWVVSCNEAAADRVGMVPADATGTPIARWPRAVEVGRLVRRAAASPAGIVEGEGADVALSLGLTDDALPPSERHVLVLLAD